MTRVIINLLFTFLLAVGSNMSYAGKSCLSLKMQPVNSKGEEIKTFCVVPLYSKSKGTRWLSGEIKGQIDSSRFLIWVSEKTEEMTEGCRWESDQIIPIPLGVTGSGIYPVAGTMLYLKRGYAPSLQGGSAGRREITRFLMTEGDSESIVEHLLSGHTDQNRLVEIYKQSPKQEIIDEFSDEEREKLRRCYYGGEVKEKIEPGTLLERK